MKKPRTKKYKFLAEGDTFYHSDTVTRKRALALMRLIAKYHSGVRVYISEL